MSKKIEWERIEPVWATTSSVIAVWVFGSAQNGQIKVGSDVDIGVLFDSPPSLDEQIDLLINLQKALQFDDVDLTPLNKANPILRFEAISGQPLFCRDAGRRAEFASLTAREYEDEMAFIERAMLTRQ